jgi:hypothetical protein
LTKFDEIFAVLDDDDGPKMKRVFDWAISEGREKTSATNCAQLFKSGQLSDADIEKRSPQ